MKKLFIIKAGSTFPATAANHGDFEERVICGLGIPRRDTRVIDACRGDALPAPEDCIAAIITGAHCMVTDNLPWSLAIESWIPSLVQSETPLLGICYGHQLLARAMGGHVDFHPHGKEVGTVDIRLTGGYLTDPLFAAQPRRFPAHATHAQSVLSLPPEAVLLAENNFEPHHAFRIGPCAWGGTVPSRVQPPHHARLYSRAGREPHSLGTGYREAVAQCLRNPCSQRTPSPLCSAGTLVAHPSLLSLHAMQPGVSPSHVFSEGSP